MATSPDKAEQEGHKPSEPLHKRTQQAMDEVLDHVKSVNLDLISGLFGDVGQKYERSGPPSARLLVLGKREDSSFEGKHKELNALIQAIDTIERHHLPRAEGGYLLRKLQALKKFYLPEEEKK